MFACLLLQAAPAIPHRLTDQGLVLVAFMLLIGLAVATLLITKGPALIAAWRAGSAEQDIPAQLDRIEADLGALKRALLTENDEGHQTATSRKLAADLAVRLDRIEAQLKAALRKRQ